MLLATLSMGACSSDGGAKAGSTPTTVAVSTSTTAAVETTTTVPKFTGVDSAAMCALDAGFRERFAVFTMAANAPITTLRTAYLQAIAAVTKMEHAASPEIKPTIATLRDALVRTQPYMDRAHYLAAKLDAAGRAIVAGQAMVTATNRFAAYEIEVCKRAGRATP